GTVTSSSRSGRRSVVFTPLPPLRRSPSLSTLPSNRGWDRRGEGVRSPEPGQLSAGCRRVHALSASITVTSRRDLDQVPGLVRGRLVEDDGEADDLSVFDAEVVRQ